MKKHLGLLGVTLLSAAVFAHAKPVQAIVDYYDESTSQYEDVIGSRKDEPSTPFIAISLKGKDVDDQDKKFEFTYFDFQFLNNPLSREELLKQIQYIVDKQFGNGSKYKVVGFDKDAKIEDTHEIYNSDQLNTFSQFNLSNQKYSLTGNILLKKVDDTISNFASKVDYFYTASFFTIDDTGRKVYLGNHLEYNIGAIQANVGDKLSSKDLNNYAQYIVAKNSYEGGKLKDYVIVKREDTTVHQNVNTQTEKTFNIPYDENEEFEITFNPRQFEYKVNQNKQPQYNNVDTIHETFEVVRRDQWLNWQFNNKNINVGATKGGILDPSQQYEGLSDSEKQYYLSQNGFSLTPPAAPTIEEVEEVIYWYPAPQQEETGAVLDPKTGLPYVNLDSDRKLNPKTGLPESNYYGMSEK
ncbi:hypothetical protein [Streptococcus dysgalactiae]|uniref:hypothetical protein n=1 Tax=Streptococcus dysgalactiae TaxID=1334 RepID=UPI002DD42841|nr:hypothetical protein [Streptococcus dysgalactiae]MEC4576737.1 hypothetical protein [Streptococcus dysgalactiae]